MITDPRHLRENAKMFRKWLNVYSDSADDDYKNHAVDVLKSWLDEKLPKLKIGNIFKYDDVRKYNSLKETIMSTPSYEGVNSRDSRGRPNAALNHYSKYLSSFAIGELKNKLEEKHPSNGRKRIVGIFKKRV